MALNFTPKKGQILLCDFEPGFKEPEMTKMARPVIVLAAKHGLVTVVACSTVEPDKIQECHYQLPRQSMPKCKHFMGRDSWVKGDMVYTVGFHRLTAVCIGKEAGRRIYHRDTLGREQMVAIHRCVLHGIGMGFLVHHVSAT